MKKKIKKNNVCLNNFSVFGAIGLKFGECMLLGCNYMYMQAEYI